MKLTYRDYTLIVFCALLCFAVPAVLHAQFKQPLPEELSMTSDAKAPDADAVILDYEMTTDDVLHIHTIYARIKVLKEKGKSLGTVQVPYTDKFANVADIKARTIHADGTVIPFEGKAEDLLLSKDARRQVNAKVFNLPSVEVGSVLEYRYKIRYDDQHFSAPYWEIQGPYFVHEAHYAFRPLPQYKRKKINTPDFSNIKSGPFIVDASGDAMQYLVGKTRLPKGAGFADDNDAWYRLDLRDIPPVPDEAWMPPVNSVLYRVEFYYMTKFSPVDFWGSAAKIWSKDVDRFTEPDRTIRDAVQGLVSSNEGDLEKAKKLYAAVQKLENTDFTREKSQGELRVLGEHESRSAGDTWRQKSGSGQDIALLYLAMLRAAKVRAYATQVVNRDHAILAMDDYSLAQFNDYMVVLSIAGQEILVDPAEKGCPFAMLHWRHSGVGGIRQSTGNQVLWVTPNTDANTNTTVRNGFLSVGEKGEVSGVFRITMSGQTAIYWRQAALLNGEGDQKMEYKKYMNSLMPVGVEATDVNFLGLDEAESSLMAVVKVKGNVGTVKTGHLYMPEFFLESRTNHPFTSTEKREEPVDMHYAEKLMDRVTYQLPAGYKLDATPKNERFAWETRETLESGSESDSDSVTIIRTLTRNFSTVEREEYPELHEFYLKLASADQQQLIISKH